MTCVVVLTLFFMGLVVALVINVWVSGHIEDLNDLLPYKMVLWGQSCIFIIASTGFLLYGIRAHSVMKTSEKWNQVLYRLNLVMGSCTLCATLRVVMLLILYLDVYLFKTGFFPDKPVLWLALSQWIPFYGLLFIIQYVTRKSEVTTWTDTPILWNSTATTSRRTAYTGRIDEEDEDGLAIILRKTPSTPSAPLYGLSGSDNSESDADFGKD